jgi:Sulfotransferase domain
MLIISYGIPKSGSTLAYELVRGMLLNAGHSQDLENKDRRGVQPLERRMKRNFSGQMGRAEIAALLEQIGPDSRIAVKTHAWFEEESYSWIDALCEKGEVLVIASCRDPRDICLSLLDAAGRARDAGTAAFANVRDMEHAAKKVKHRVNDFRIWASFRNAVRLDYEDVAFDTVKAIDKIERALGIVCNREEVLRYALEDAVTLKNKAKSHRHKEEMTEAQRQILDEHFRAFLRNVVERDDQVWFDKMREKLLKQSEA